MSKRKPFDRQYWVILGHRKATGRRWVSGILWDDIEAAVNMCKAIRRCAASGCTYRVARVRVTEVEE